MMVSQLATARGLPPLRSLLLREMDSRRGVCSISLPPRRWRSSRRLSSLTTGSETGLKALAASKHLGRLTLLNATSSDIGPKGLAALSRSSRLAGLRVLYLILNACGDAGAKALAASKHLTALSELYLSENQLGPKGARDRRIARLRATHDARAGVQRFRCAERTGAAAGAARLNKLRVLNVAGTLIGIEGALSILVEAPPPPQRARPSRPRH